MSHASRHRPQRKSAGSKRREDRIIQTVSCPACETPLGQPCRWYEGRPVVCPERRSAWQHVRELPPKE